MFKKYPNKSSSFRLMMLTLSVMLGVFILIVSTLEMEEVHAVGTITGVVYRELPVTGAVANVYGTRQANELGVGNVTVTAYDNNNTMQGTATTYAYRCTASGVPDASCTGANTPALGSYTLNAGGTGPYRIEFSGWPAYLQPGAIGADSASSVQFVADGATTANMGLHNPADFSDPAPRVAIARFATGVRSTTAPTGTIISFDYGYIGDIRAALTIEGTNNGLGSVWGLAYDRTNDRIFSSAFLKRHVGLGPGSGITATMTDKLGSIYSTNIAGAPNESWFVTIPNAGTITSTRGLGARDASTYDDEAFARIGRVGLGDIDISDDDRFLYVTNLNDKRLYVVDIASQLVSSNHAIPDPGCTHGQFMPFAVNYHDGLVYVGGVCNGETGGTVADLSAYVYTFNPATPAFNATPVLTIPLNYQREYVNLETDLGAAGEQIDIHSSQWHTWTDTYTTNAYNTLVRVVGANTQHIIAHPVPMLTDIDFQADGTMLIGFADRTGHQFGAFDYVPGSSPATNILENTFAAGDILRAELVGGVWNIEPHVTAPIVPVPPLPPVPTEFFTGDRYEYADGSGFPTYPGDYYHLEVSNGSTAHLAGSEQLFLTAMDPYHRYDSGGVIRLSTTNGTHIGGTEIFWGGTDGTIHDSGNFTQNGQEIGGLGKSHGMGDIELLSAPSPLEIGNQLWCDADADGLQDPNEVLTNTFPAVTVVMSCGAESASVTTNANGAYLFTDAIWAAANGGNTIPRNSSCTISIATTGANAAALTSACGGAVPSPNDQTPLSDGRDDTRDSDGTATVGGVSVTFTTGRSGENSHEYDFGFRAPPPVDWGDLPDSFDTTTAQSGPHHAITDTLYLGSCVDAEADGAPDAEAGTDAIGGDDNAVGAATGGCTGNDDEDGVTLVTPLIPGATACVEVDAHNTTGGNVTLYGWMDFDGDGQFDGDANESLTFSSGGTIANGGATDQRACFTVPAGATFDGGETHMRFRLTTDTLTATQWGGSAANGEVEDYWKPLACVGNYLWMDDGATANTQDGGDTAVADGTAVNLVWGGPDGVIGGGDDVVYTTTTTGGVYNFCGLFSDPSGDSTDDQYQIVIPVLPGMPVTPNAGGDDALDSDGDANGNGPLFTVPNPIVNMDDAPNDADPNHYPDDQTDLTYDFGFQYVDWGDLPDSGAGTGVGNYNTNNSDSGPYHRIDGTTYLGSCVDSEGDGQPDTEAGNAGGGSGNGDDGNSSTAVGSCTAADDEDGVVFVTPLIPGGTACVDVTTSVAGRLNGWIDFNNDGDFDDAGERIFSSEAMSAGLNHATSINAANATCFTVPATAVAITADHAVYSRFRYTAGQEQGGQHPTGAATTGEVEDYYQEFMCLGDLVWHDADNSGTVNGSESGFNGVDLELFFDFDGDGIFEPGGDDGPAISTTTSALVGGVNGSYSFCGLTNGNYFVRIPNTEFDDAADPLYKYGSSTANNDPETNVDNDDNGDDNGNAAANGIVSPPITLATGTEPTTADANTNDNGNDDDNTNMTLDFGLMRPVAIGNVLWVDDGAGGGEELNGKIDGAEKGVPGAVVELYFATQTPGTDTPVLTTTTNTAGEYLFDRIAEGSYIVHVPASEFVYGEPLSSFVSSDGNGPDDAIDDNSNENGIDNADPAANGISSTTIALAVGTEPTSEAGQGSYGGTLADADANMTVDFGFFELLTLGNYVWLDTNQDGVIDSGEQPVPNVVIYLLDVDGKPVLNPLTHQPISTTTDSNGFYQFTHLRPGEYRVLVGAVNFQAGGALENYFSTPGGVDPDDDVDTDDNGIDNDKPWVNGIMSEPLRMDYGREPDNNADSDDNNNTNLTVDFGFVTTPTAVTLSSFTITSNGSQTILVEWTTESELDNAFFKLYRSRTADFDTAVRIYVVPTAVPGGSGPGTSYSYTDTVPENGIWYYWLVDVDVDGVETVHAQYEPQSVTTGMFTIFLPTVVR